MAISMTCYCERGKILKGFVPKQKVAGTTEGKICPLPGISSLIVYPLQVVIIETIYTQTKKWTLVVVFIHLCIQIHIYVTIITKEKRLLM